MSPAQQARAAWFGLPGIVRGIVIALGSIGATTILIGSALDIPARVTQTESDITRMMIEDVNTRIDLDDHERRLMQTDLRFEYLICLMEADRPDPRRTASQCSSDYARP